MDVIAVGEKEVIIVQVKAIVNEKRVVEKVKSFFVHATQFLESGKAPDQNSSISWWMKGRKIKKVLVYEYYSSPSYLNELKRSGIEVWHFNTYFDEIIEYISSKNGVKEENPLMRMLHYLKANNKIITDNG